MPFKRTEPELIEKKIQLFAFFKKNSLSVRDRQTK